MLSITRSAHLPLTLLLSSVLLSCAGRGGSTAEPGGSDDVGTPDTPWAQKDWEQRREYMGVYVFPKMKELFVGHDANGFADFGCKTCHGDDGEQLRYKMPNDLLALSATDPVAAGNEFDPQTTKFMLEQVVPAMNELLGGDGTTKVSCLTCHSSEE